MSLFCAFRFHGSYEFSVKTKKMLKKSIHIFLLIFLFACDMNKQDNPNASHGPFTTTDEDIVINQAIKEANHSLATFDSALKSANKNFTAFNIKQRFVVDSGKGEHIWISNISLKDAEYFGIVGNVPEDPVGVNYGDTIKIDKRKISDWMYLDGDKLRGGYTIKVVREKMSAEEKKTFDEENGFVVE